MAWAHGPLLPSTRTGANGLRPRTRSRLIMGTITLAAVLTAAWAGSIALLAADPVSCLLVSEDMASMRCGRIAERFEDLAPFAALALLVPLIAGVGLGWWPFVAGAAVAVLGTLPVCALLWSFLMGALSPGGIAPGL
ncbi:hypothetical protein PWG71_05345 [Nocardiopsis sp. N85]|uniref:hypothetical protein n=1 Tax=Nocardiopsis sp. N85 TaxID=3029400 RepID=UPI00237F4926|nr:hypothetical protein [Nocardiopsis sp. N85]MDE3720804.1 hypothetical protein [Nocardiopsis sp. N85]